MADVALDLLVWVGGASCSGPHSSASGTSPAGLHSRWLLAGPSAPACWEGTCASPVCEEVPAQPRQGLQLTLGPRWVPPPCKRSWGNSSPQSLTGPRAGRGLKEPRPQCVHSQGGGRGLGAQ